jgi:hypothetical protein
VAEQGNYVRHYSGYGRPSHTTTGYKTMTEYTIDQYILQLLFAEYNAEHKYWWYEMVLSEAYQNLPQHEYAYLEDICQEKY